MPEIDDPCVFFGESSLSELGAMLDAGGHRSVLLVTGRASYEASAVSRLLAPVLAGREVTRVSDFETNPKKDDVVRILNEIQGVDFTAVIAVGGGSVMDVAKLIKCFNHASDQIDQVLYSGGDPAPSSAALFALPTTAGSGSEATQFAVLYDRGTKYSVSHPELLPDAAWVLPSALASVPREVAAAAAMDAFCQGVESYWSIHSTDKSKETAQEAVGLAWENMVAAVVDREPAALEAMGRASHLAGQAINVTRTTAPHAVSYALTTYFGISHGHAVALMLPEILKFNAAVTEADLLDARGVDYVKTTLDELGSMIGCSSPLQAARAITDRMEVMALSTDLHALGIKTSRDRELVIKHGFNPGRVNNNPRRMTEGDLRGILDSMLGAY